MVPSQFSRWLILHQPVSKEAVKVYYANKYVCTICATNPLSIQFRALPAWLYASSTSSSHHYSYTRTSRTTWQIGRRVRDLQRRGVEEVCLRARHRQQPALRPICPPVSCHTPTSKSLGLSWWISLSQVMILTSNLLTIRSKRERDAASTFGKWQHTLK